MIQFLHALADFTTIVKDFGILTVPIGVLGWWLSRVMKRNAVRTALSVDILSTLRAFEELRGLIAADVRLTEAAVPAAAKLDANAGTKPTNADVVAYLRTLASGYVIGRPVFPLAVAMEVINKEESGGLVLFDDRIQLFSELERQYSEAVTEALKRSGNAPQNEIADGVTLEFVDRTSTFISRMRAHIGEVCRLGEGLTKKLPRVPTEDLALWHPPQEVEPKSLASGNVPAVSDPTPAPESKFRSGEGKRNQS